MTITFCAIDDHDIVLHGLEAMAAREPDLEYLGGAADGRHGIRLVEHLKPGIVLLDLRLGKTSSFSVLEEITQRVPSTLVVMFTAFANEDLLERAIRAGVAGYVLKNTSTTGLPDVLRLVARDGLYFDPRLAHSALRRRIGAGSQPPTFTERELHILRLIAAGRNNHEIASEIHVSSHTVKLDVARLLQRFGVHRRTELVRILMERQLID